MLIIQSTHLIARDIQVHIRHLKRRIAYLEDQALKLVLHDETQKRAYQRLCSTPGIAQTSTLRLWAELARLPEDMQLPQGVGFQTQTIRDCQPKKTHLENRE